MSAQPSHFVRGAFYPINDNGAWSWFMDERALIDKDRVLVGSVRANGTFKDSRTPGLGECRAFRV